MENEVILDIAHISFLDLIRTFMAQSGAASAKGTLMRTAMDAAKRFKPVDYPTFDDFVRAIDRAETPIAKVEGRARHFGDGIFGLPACPFGESIQSYKSVFGALPEGFGEITSEFNATSAVNDRFHVGEGAGVSPFCAVHQPLRSALAQAITIGGKPIEVYQLGCKSGAGVKGMAEKWCEATGCSVEKAKAVLDQNMCCYFVKVLS